MTIALKFIEGFDHWMQNPTVSGREFTIQGNTPHAWSLAGTTTSGVEFQQGRYGADASVSGHYCIMLKADSNDDRRLATLQTVSDANSLYVGFNAKLGVSTAVTATGFHRFCGFADSDPGGASGNSANQKLTFLVNANSGGVHSLHLVQGAVITDNSGGSPTILATGLPARECWNTWTYFEIGLYRSATSGTCDMWIETATGGVENILHYAGDTSIATVGTISRFYLSSARQGGVTAGQTSNYFDDFWLATGGRPGVPCYVMPRWPSSDAAGASGFTPATGSTLFDQIIHPPMGVQTGATGQGPWVNYIRSTYTASGADVHSAYFAATAGPYTPNAIFGIETICAGFKVTATAVVQELIPHIRKAGVSITAGRVVDVMIGYADATTWIANSMAMRYSSQVIEQDPDTVAAWTPSTVDALTFGVATTGATATGVASNIYLSVLLVLQSKATGAVASGGGGGGGVGTWPFWMVQTG